MDGDVVELRSDVWTVLLHPLDAVRNAMGEVKAINAARMALRGDGTHVVTLDKVIETMRETGADMEDKDKETSRGGLAVNVIEC